MPRSESDLANLLSERLRTIASTGLDNQYPVSVQININPNGHAVAVIESNAAEQLQHCKPQLERAAHDIDGINSITIIFTAHGNASSHTTKKRQMPPTPQTAKHKPTTPSNNQPDQHPNPKSQHQIKQIIAIVSAKGGVGKSTVAVNLAVTAAQQKLHTGLLDADIHGPSIPTMLGTADQSHQAVNRNGQKMLIPIEAHGLLSASMGHIAQRDQAVVWRGPMVSSALWQLFDQVLWGTLDLLVVDTPPGTGDVLLTLVQKISPSGVIIVTTPQEVALADVARGQQVFAKINTPILGVIENMSWYENPSTGQHIHMFGRGGGQRAADAFGVPLLANIPINPNIGISCDQGKPAVLDDQISQNLYQRLINQIRNTPHL